MFCVCTSPGGAVEVIRRKILTAEACIQPDTTEQIQSDALPPSIATFLSVLSPVNELELV